MVGSRVAAGPVGHVAALLRYPVKSMAGERLARAALVEHGVVGDRWWAAYTSDGGIGSGKNTRRFRRVDGLLALRAFLHEAAEDTGVPWVHFPDGADRRADDPAASQALSALLGQPLRLRQQSAVPHHDESPVHLVTTAALRHLGQLHGEPVQAARFRPNVVLEVDGSAFVEDDWQGRELALGDQAVLRLGTGMPRCLMVGSAQPHDGLAGEARLLETLGQTHHVEFGQQAAVLRPGTVRVGDVASLR